MFIVYIIKKNCISHLRVALKIKLKLIIFYFKVILQIFKLILKQKIKKFTFYFKFILKETPIVFGTNLFLLHFFAFLKCVIFKQYLCMYIV